MEDLKKIVKEKYSLIANQQKFHNKSSCCGATKCRSTLDYPIFGENYEKLDGYNPDADLGLGCGLPTQYAAIKKGDHVLDLGSGAGNDCFVARAIVGETGKVTGLDFTDAMLAKANENVKKLGFTNVEFIKGDIEEMPMSDNQYDIVVSNCVLNLVPDKNKAFAEIMRVLKPHGHFCISDVVLKGTLPAKLKEAAEMYVGCVSGALQKNEYMDIIKKQGFSEITINSEKLITIPDDILSNYLSKDEIEDIHKDKFGIFSITIYAKKQ